MEQPERDAVALPGPEHLAATRFIDADTRWCASSPSAPWTGTGRAGADPVRANILLPGDATATGMVPPDVPDGTRCGLLDPAIMGPPIVWLASDEARGVHDQRIVATEFGDWLARR